MLHEEQKFLLLVKRPIISLVVDETALVQHFHRAANAGCLEFINLIMEISNSPAWQTPNEKDHISIDIRHGDNLVTSIRSKMETISSSHHLQGQGKPSQCKREGIHPWQSFNWSIPPWNSTSGATCMHSSTEGQTWKHPSMIVLRPLRRWSMHRACMLWRREQLRNWWIPANDASRWLFNLWNVPQVLYNEFKTPQWSCIHPSWNALRFEIQQDVIRKPNSLVHSSKTIWSGSNS